MRVPGWQVALEQVMQSAHGRPFRWGQHDCCQFIARAAAAVSGIDGRKHFARYRNKREAELVLTASGGFVGLLTRAFGEPVHPSRAGIGDVVLIDMGKNGLQPALCMGLNSYAPGRLELVHRPTAFAVAAWNT